jgi:hypothetical protein
MLASHRSATHDYRPYVTVGRVADEEDTDRALAEARRTIVLPQRGVVAELVLFRRAGPTDGEIVSRLAFGSASAAH